jgi:hypothetical protein
MEYKPNTLMPHNKHIRFNKRAIVQDEEEGLFIKNPTQLHRPLGFGRFYRLSHMNIVIFAVTCCMLLWVILRIASAAPMVCALNTKTSSPELLQSLTARTSSGLIPLTASKHPPSRKSPGRFLQGHTNSSFHNTIYSRIPHTLACSSGAAAVHRRDSIDSIS